MFSLDFFIGFFEFCASILMINTNYNNENNIDDKNDNNDNYNNINNVIIIILK